jgi:DnaJ-class molecular chaperone
MTYKLKGGEAVIRGVLHGWTGRKCPRCKGTGQVRRLNTSDYSTDERRCMSCGGTGDEHGVMPVQPADLPGNTE